MCCILDAKKIQSQVVIRNIWIQAARFESGHLDIDAFVCLADAGDGRGRGLAGVGGGTGVVGRIQEALLWPPNVRQATQQICASSPAASSSYNVSVSVSVCLSPHQAEAEPQTHLRAIQGSGHVAFLSDAWVCVGEASPGRVVHRGGGLFVTVREGCGWVFWRHGEEIKDAMGFYEDKEWYSYTNFFL